MNGTGPQTLSVDDALQQALAHHKAGRLQEAERLYRAILQTQPDQPDANHNLGVLAGQVGQHAAGLPYLKTALAINPSEGQYALSYAEALLATGQAGEALNIVRRAMQRGLNSPAAQALWQRVEAAALSDTTKAVAPTPVEMNQLFELYDTGRHADLETRARLLIDQHPASGFAWKVLGVALQVQGKDALLALQKAVQFMPDDAEAHYNLGNALRGLGQLEDAASSYRRALEIRPDYVEALINLGNVQKDLGHLTSAAASYRRALEINPDHAEVHSNLGLALQGLGQIDDAVACYRRALELKPDYAEAHINLGISLKDLGQLEDAVASYRRALEIQPGYVEAHANLAAALQALGKIDEAVASYRRALEIQPVRAELHSDLGIALQSLGQADDAMASFRRALEINPGYVEAHVNLGNALKALLQLDRAVASYRRALEIKPDFAEAHINLGNALRDLGQRSSALASYRRALEINPNIAAAHYNLANVQHDLSQLDAAVASCRRALEIDPYLAEAHSNLLFSLSQSEAVDSQALFDEHCRFAERFEAPLRGDWPRHTNSRDPARSLRIGFVSADLRNHAVAHFIEPVLAHLSSYPQLSLHAYSNHVIEDAVTQRLRGYLAHWHPIATLSDDALARQISADGIDILIDLTGHASLNRLRAFARKPAPVQASWMGYPGTTGLRAMDYYLADRFFLPYEQFVSQFTEKFAYLPANAPFMPSKEAPPVNALPALANGYVTFGSFNHFSKINRSVIALWSQLLRALPNARMVLGNMFQAGENNTLIEWFAQEGIARERLSLYPRCDMVAYLGLHHQADICLDTFPYNGGTTTCHALWMGVPTLTLAGSRAAGRTGAAILGHVGLEAFIGHDAEDFVRKGLSRAGDLTALSDIRAELRERFSNSALGQPALVAEGLQRALRVMWERWCRGLSPVVIDVSDSKSSGETCRSEDEKEREA